MGASFPSDDVLGVDKPRDKTAPCSSLCYAAFEPCPYCGVEAFFKDDAVGFVHSDECPQGDCEPYRISLIGVQHAEKWNKWAKQIKDLQSA